ncbi:MAG: DegV family protein [Oscillospiraceae bacterium]|nr:DegV family protein [Oscillospiraceae bacterium]
MRTVKIVADSSADVLELKHTAFAAAPLKIITAEREFVDDAALDVAAMVNWFDSYKGKSKTSCPNTSDWLDAFGDAIEVYCVTLTSGLSGSYNAACAAKQLYESEYPGRRVCVIDSLSAGPELTLIVEKLEQDLAQGLSFDEICREIEAYKQKTGLTFMLESLKNFAANGRVSPAVAKIAGVLGIRIVGKASDKGTLEPTNKCRGTERSLAAILTHLKENGLSKGKVRIAHCMNESAAQKLKTMILTQMEQAEVKIHLCRGLCSYYAEKGGLLVGFEKF